MFGIYHLKLQREKQPVCAQPSGPFNDRGTMFFQVLRFIEYHKPKVVIIENVQGLLNHDGGRTFGG
jgi:DNA (cytosine-5)-methyltransferase 1